MKKIYHTNFIINKELKRYTQDLNTTQLHHDHCMFQVFRHLQRTILLVYYLLQQRRANLPPYCISFALLNVHGLEVVAASTKRSYYEMSPYLKAK